MASDIFASADLAAEGRQVFLRHVAQAMSAVAQRIDAFLLEPDSNSATGVVQACREFLPEFRHEVKPWLQACKQGFEQLPERLNRARYPEREAPESPQELSLLAEEAVETQILSARAALAVMDKAAGPFNDLRLRLQHLEDRADLDRADPVHANLVIGAVLHAWLGCHFTRAHWELCEPVLHQYLAVAVAGGYQKANHFFLDHGVLPEIDLRELVRRAPDLPVAMPEDVQASMAGALTTRSTGFSFGQTSPNARRSHEVSGRLMRFLHEHLPQRSDWQSTRPANHEPQAAQESANAPLSARGEGGFASTQGFGGGTVIDWSSLEKGVAGVREQVRAIKKAASSDQDKAVIEVVALIFDTILTEERIPPGIRLWFARLQIPVLRMAVKDPSFLATDQHPARLLLDRMGVCVLGFDANLSMEPLEKEIKRIVQVIEQYPETGRRVFELMYQEFVKFLSAHLQSQGSVERVASVAQQVEQRETLAIQYTIELRKMLDQVQVNDAVRDFLFQTWSEVMALAALKFGANDEQSLQVRKTARDLLWASSAKASRHERAQVIAKVPALLEQLNAGMALLGYDASRQAEAIKHVRNTLAEAFMSRTEPIDPQWLDDLTLHLEGLENYLSEDEDAEDAILELNRDNLEWITGLDATHIVVWSNPAEPADDQARAQATDLQLGAWFDLDHAEQVHHVQLAWLSERKQLFLFVTPDQQSFLLQRGRVAACLAHGALRPIETEGLTTRATRNALDKLDANPDLLLA